ncbi:arsenate reductase ArsC [uncultured Corynebacterium sp.]|uniref:arsenate reductase ArsC n=1 Tax=uncultured Corynebacterium sp. TaxID=159447 RepID=UPI002616589B|nr:arsenate reductase ArsC [uncultured Corynebacterium sp.]
MFTHKPKVAFICVHNSCRSQIAEAISKTIAADVFVPYSAGVSATGVINSDAVRVLEERWGIDMADQESKTIDDIPEPDIVISMGCMEGCPLIGRGYDEDWGIPDPTGKSDDAFVATIRTIEEKVRDLASRLQTRC